MPGMLHREVIVAALEEAGCSYREAAARVGVAPGSLSPYLAGWRKVPPSVLARFKAWPGDGPAAVRLRALAAEAADIMEWLARG